MHPIKVAVSQRVIIESARGEVRDALDQRLVSWLSSLGAVPIPVPNILQKSPGLDSWLRAVLPRAIVLTGGNDIGETQNRESTETTLIEYAAKRRLPMLGICRGMQMMAHYAGTGLETVSGHAGERHRLQREVGSSFPEEVNSYHHWRISSCPPGYIVTARSDDGVIEAIQHKHLSWEGWMWHPEREVPFNSSDMRRGKRVLLGE